ncbi:hypothetical protein TNCV_4654281 [Trichonephila clavipes]|nr:hypothetical protein TNCV_4654281 [Trichonephila clavipes]
MSRQRDLLETMPWRVIGKVESWQTQIIVVNTVEVARSEIRNLWNQYHEEGHVRRRPEQDHKHVVTQIMTVPQAKQSEIGFMKVELYAHRPMVCISLTARHRGTGRKWAFENPDWMQND